MDHIDIEEPNIEEGELNVKVSKEEFNKRRSELIEVKIILALLYMIIDEKNKAFKNIESALSYDISNYKIKEIYNEIKCDLAKDEEKEESEELTFSEFVFILDCKLLTCSCESTDFFALIDFSLFNL